MIITDETAWEFWKTPTSRNYRHRLDYCPDDGCLSAFEDIQRLDPGRYGMSDRPHLLVPSKKYRASKTVVYHVWQQQLPMQSLVKLEFELAIAGPELSFLHFATAHSFGEAVDFGSYLCGSYYIDVDDKIKQRIPLTSKRRISEFLDQMPTCRGIRRARDAAEYIFEGAASPMEHKMAELLSLPTCYGGLSVPRGTLNNRIELGEKAQEFCGHNYCVGDYCFPDALIDIEYDSDDHHSTKDEMENDAMRRDALHMEGWTVYEIVAPILYDPGKLQHLAEGIKQQLGQDARIRAKDFLRKADNLRAAILPRYNRRFLRM